MKLIKALLIPSLFILSMGTLNSTFAEEDTRTPIVTTEDERNLVLGEMRQFLETVRSITIGLSNDDMETVAKAAKKMGMAASGEVPDVLAKKLPQTFKVLAMKVHMGFDELALNASSMGDTQETLEQLGKILSNCTACHATYRLPEPTK